MITKGRVGGGEITCDRRLKKKEEEKKKNLKKLTNSVSVLFPSPHWLHVVIFPQFFLLIQGIFHRFLL